MEAELQKANDWKNRYELLSNEYKDKNERLIKILERVEEALKGHQPKPKYGGCYGK